MIRLAIFDCDGTLVDSGASIITAVSDAFASHGLVAPPPRQCRRVIGLSLTEAFDTLAPDSDSATRARLVDSYKQAFFEARADSRVEEPLFEGIADLLDRLEESGWLLAVATGKSDRGLAHCLDRHRLTGRFVSLQTADRHPSKPDPSMALQAMADAGSAPAATIVIGDTAYDMGMACAAGATGYGAAWGYHDAHELLGSGATAVADSPLDILDLLAARESTAHG